MGLGRDILAQEHKLLKAVERRELETARQTDTETDREMNKKQSSRKMKNSGKNEKGNEKLWVGFAVSRAEERVSW